MKARNPRDDEHVQLMEVRQQSFLVGESGLLLIFYQVWWLGTGMTTTTFLYLE